MILDDLSTIQISHIIDMYVHSDRDRAIMKRRLIDGITYERLAEEFALSDRQIKNIVYKNKNKLIKHI